MSLSPAARTTAALAFSCLFPLSLPADAEAATQPSHGTVPAADAAVRLTPAEPVDVDCVTVRDTLARVVEGGRGPAAMRALLEARRSTDPCVLEAAEEARIALGIERGELLAALLRSGTGFEARPTGVRALQLEPRSEGSGELRGVSVARPILVSTSSGAASPCGVELETYRVDIDGRGAARLVATLRNATGEPLTRHSTVLAVRRRGTAAWRVGSSAADDASFDRPVGEQATWDANTASWRDPREQESPRASFGFGSDRLEVRSPLGFLAEPGERFEVSTRLSGWRTGRGTEDLDVHIDRCEVSTAGAPRSSSR